MVCHAVKKRRFLRVFRVIDIVYHFLISMALIYFGIPSSAEWLIFIVIVVEFGAVKIIVDSRNKDD